MVSQSTAPTEEIKAGSQKMLQKILVPCALFLMRKSLPEVVTQRRLC